MFLTDEPTAPALGLDLPPWRVRVIARAPIIEGLPVQLDTPLLNDDTDNMQVAEDSSGLVNATYTQASAARTGRLIGLGLESIGDNQRGYVLLRGLAKMWVTGTGSAGDAISVGNTENGNRFVAIALEAWTTLSLINVLFDGVSAFGVYLATPDNSAPVVTITSPPDGSEFVTGVTITFTGTAIDLEDGDISATLDWTSDVDGVIATNDNSFTKSDLSVGRHLITASTTDSGGKSGSDAIVVTITHPGGDHDPPDGSLGGIRIA